MTTLPIADDVAAEARQGSWCPKLCTFACPVTTATGDQHAVPWSFHRVVTDLVDGRVEATADAVAGRLDLCSGCLACQGPCTFDQDVPSQVLAGRAVAPVGTARAEAVLDHLREGRRPDGDDPVAPRADVAADTTLFVGCQDDPADVDAAVALLEAAGRTVRVAVAAPCCGGVARDLGHVAMADDLATATAAAVDHRDDHVLVAIDPHCSVGDRAPTPVVELLASLLDDTDFAPDGTADAVVVHDPCVTVRRHGVVDAPRRLLAAAGLVTVEPEGSGHDTVCSGAGLSLPLVDEHAASLTSARRVDLLGDGPTVTWCRRAQDRLHDAGADVSSLLVLLRRRLADT